MPCSFHFYQNPPQITRGKMQYLYDDYVGGKYLDFFAGVSVMNCGHSNDTIIKDSIEQMKTLQHTTTIYLTQPIVDLAEKLSKVLPGDLNKSFFCLSGSEANEGAMLLAKLYTGNNEFIYLDAGLHGRTHLTMSVTGIDMWRASPNPELGTHRATGFYPNVAQNDFDLELAMNKSISSIEEILIKQNNKIAALIIEPIQGNGGILTPHKEYFIKLKSLLIKHNVLLIVDEVQTGFARTGKMFAIENFGITPDIMTIAKALGNGQPISAFCTTNEIAASFTRPSASTLGGNPVSSTTAISVLNYIENHSLCEHASKMGDYLTQGLQYLQNRHNIIRDIRGIGLMQGAELVEGISPAIEKTDKILESMKDNGILIGKNGLSRNVLAFQPPLVICKENIDECINKLDVVLKLV
ncbi:aminotransferase class III-fold pyridoxal phosphate-dependent enzyme [Alkalibaculum sp. M08DMB]|uniref:alanine--glyoxylate transaminase n=2 Tax=Alkalibaculum sporogenes TaxID=2655001 RepID=A0A6A7KCK2_9FIRM|nr:aminotransferase class III-fold pyridoxal phosphate-dependent enzyme [Alkalibaculum sporogenes]